MPLVPPRFASLLMAKMASKAMVGPMLFPFCNAIATGSVLSIVGKPFQTTDVGLIPGVGFGTGIGIVGVPPSLVKSQIITIGLSFGLVGIKLMDVADAVAEALVAEIAFATLTSTHAPVFLGNGNITTGSILVTGPEWGGQITSQGFSQGMAGAQWPQMANAIGMGCALGFLTATGVVTITGTFTGPVPPGPVPGAGVGSGFIT
jgi:hypothetical protein